MGVQLDGSFGIGVELGVAAAVDELLEDDTLDVKGSGRGRSQAPGPRPAATSSIAVRTWWTRCSTRGWALVRKRTVSSWK